MLSNVTAIISSIPGAFHALGIGTIGMIGPYLLGFSTAQIWPNILQMEESKLSEVPGPLQTTIEISLIFVMFFFTYAFGLIYMQAGSMIRRNLWRTFDSTRVAVVIASNNPALEKLFQETRNSVSVLDGLGVSVSIFITSFSLFLNLSSHWISIPIGLFFGFGFGYVFLRMSEEILISFDEILRRTEAMRK